LFVTERQKVFKFAHNAKLYDLATVTPMILWLGAGMVGSVLSASEMLRSQGNALAICSQITTVLFLNLAIVLLIIRRPPVQKAKGVLPRFAGAVGCLLPFSFLALPRASLTPAMAIFSSAFVFLGTAAAILSIYWLGRSFSILPQARGLVVEGPYRLVRHPLYLSELCIVFGRVWEFQQPWTFVVMLVAIGVQISRMHFEEQIMQETFSSYRDYARRTARLIPGFY
jgi:protein-S-isoprenylcysteine O-methyltransferase Ste14